MPSPRQRVLLVGGTGVIGRHIHTALNSHHDLILAGLDGPDLILDLTDPLTLSQKLQTLGPLDGVISTAGRANFAFLRGITPAPLASSVYGLGLQDKLMGQVNLALAAREVLKPTGSITLTSGTTSDEPILGGSSLSMVNGALEHWAMAAATELAPFRINVVSPSLVEGTPEPAIAAFPGFDIVPGRKVALAYLRCLESGVTGKILRV